MRELRNSPDPVTPINKTINLYHNKNIFAFPTSVGHKENNGIYTKKIYPIKNWSKLNKLVNNDTYNYNGVAIRLENLIVIDIDNLEHYISRNLIKEFMQLDKDNQKKLKNVYEIFFENFVGMSKDESQNINDELFATAVLEENVIRHEWSEGDLIICNNYTTAHKRDGIQSKQERTLWRTTFQIPELIPLEIKTM